MAKSSLAGWNERRLRWSLAAFYALLAVPAGFLVYQAFDRIKWEAFHQQRILAEELVQRIDGHFTAVLENEETRSFADYSFLVVKGDPESGFVQRSSLSAYPSDSDLPGMIGYFQVDDAGLLSSPLLPDVGVTASAYGISDEELEERRAEVDRIDRTLRRHRLIGFAEPRPSAPADAAGPQHGLAESESFADDSAVPAALEQRAARSPSGFDQLDQSEPEEAVGKKAAGALGRVDDLKLDERYLAAEEVATTSQEYAKSRVKRKEQVALPARRDRDQAAAGNLAATPAISVFEGEIDPLAVGLLDNGRFVMYRKVWRDGRRYVQGMLVDADAFVRELIEQPFRATALSAVSDLAVAYRGDVLRAVGGSADRAYLRSADEFAGALLYRSALSAPFGDVELVFSLNRLPAGQGAGVIAWTAVALFLVLTSGFYLMYRLGTRQIRLARQQQDFISAVSHELKTPLTSIRMYGEILSEGWADEDKKREYYRYIHDEGERLSRLIDNVLQLARMTRNDVEVDLVDIEIEKLLDMLHSRIASQIEHAGFSLSMDVHHTQPDVFVRTCPDHVVQIVINLVDNALKFAAGADRQQIDVSCRPSGAGRIALSVRDYGPGVAREQIKKIFTLFYRPGNELTRETVGTGIGLALVDQLARAMGGTIDVVNREPGAEFMLVLPTVRIKPGISRVVDGEANGKG